MGQISSGYILKVSVGQLLSLFKYCKNVLSDLVIQYYNNIAKVTNKIDEIHKINFYLCIIPTIKKTSGLFSMNNHPAIHIGFYKKNCIKKPPSMRGGSFKNQTKL